MRATGAVNIERLAVSAYEIPTDAPESDGTLEWDSTTLILVELQAGDCTGIGYTYGDAAIAQLIQHKLGPAVVGGDALDFGACRAALPRLLRNLGQPGITAMAVSAVDIALWDLKARLLELPLARLLGSVRPAIAVYGSGGFTSYSIERLQRQLGGWVEQGLTRVKMKIGRQPERDLGRVRAARAAVGPETALFVDANGAYDRKQALDKARGFAELGVSWFEEPVSSDDREGLRLLCALCPPPLEISAGEYGYEPVYFRRLLEAQAVDVLQADATRCGGITGLLAAAALAQAFQIPLSTHTAPTIHVHPACALDQVRHLEYFHDHVRIEHLLFDGALDPIGGVLRPDPERPGLGVEFKHRDAARYEK